MLVGSPCLQFASTFFFLNGTAPTWIYTYLHTLSLHDALPISMRMIAPERAGLWREAGILHAQLDNMRVAILAFEHYLELAAPGEPGRQDIAELLRQLRRQLN